MGRTESLRRADRFGLTLDPDAVTYYIGHHTPVPRERRSRMAAWREKLFVFMLHNAGDPVAFFGLPPDRVFEFGIRVEVQPRDGRRAKRAATGQWLFAASWLQPPPSPGFASALQVPRPVGRPARGLYNANEPNNGVE